MRNHEPLLQLRRKGIRPVAVWLVDSPPPKPIGAQRMDWWAFDDMASAEVYVEAGDSPRRADLRFVRGMQVHVQMDDEDRMRAFVAAAVEAGASSVWGACHSYDSKRQVATQRAFTAWTQEAGWLA
jgi:hypothetical protein